MRTRKASPRCQDTSPSSSLALVSANMSSAAMPQREVTSLMTRRTQNALLKGNQGARLNSHWNWQGTPLRRGPHSVSATSLASLYPAAL